MIPKHPIFDLNICVWYITIDLSALLWINQCANSYLPNLQIWTSHINLIFKLLKMWEYWSFIKTCKNKHWMMGAEVLHVFILSVNTILDYHERNSVHSFIHPNFIHSFIHPSFIHSFPTNNLKQQDKFEYNHKVLVNVCTLPDLYQTLEITIRCQ